MEARCFQSFNMTAEQAGFPGVAQAARLTRFVDRKKLKIEEVETEWLLTSRSSDQFSLKEMAAADRRYWGIENGLHLRLDVSADEDRSRVRNPVAVLNLAMFRRATTSLAVHWIQHCSNKRMATLRGFYDDMGAKCARKAFSLVTACKPAWMPRL
jgi:predicted transposase YbfD/YdcC